MPTLWATKAMPHMKAVSKSKRLPRRELFREVKENLLKGQVKAPEKASFGPGPSTDFIVSYRRTNASGNLNNSEKKQE